MSVRATWPGMGMGIVPLEQVNGTRFGSPLGWLPQLCARGRGREGGRESLELQLLEGNQASKDKF